MTLCGREAARQRMLRRAAARLGEERACRMTVRGKRHARLLTKLVSLPLPLVTHRYRNRTASCLSTDACRCYAGTYSLAGASTCSSSCPLGSFRSGAACSYCTAGEMQGSWWLDDTVVSPDGLVRARAYTWAMSLDLSIPNVYPQCMPAVRERQSAAEDAVLMCVAVAQANTRMQQMRQCVLTVGPVRDACCSRVISCPLTRSSLCA
jgi:hypothetical protein